MILCRAQLNSAEVPESRILVWTVITGVIHLNMSIGPWEMMYSVYTEQSLLL